MRWLLLAICCCSAVVHAGKPSESEPADPAAEAPPPPPSSALAYGRKLTTQLYEGEAAKLFAASGPSFRRQFGNAEAVAAFSRTVKGQFGVELRVGSESVQERG